MADEAIVATCEITRVPEGAREPRRIVVLYPNEDVACVAEEGGRSDSLYGFLDNLMQRVTPDSSIMRLMMTGRDIYPRKVPLEAVPAR